MDGLGELALSALGGVGVEHTGLGLDDLPERPEGDALAIGQGAALAPGDQPGVRLDGAAQLGDQPALPHPRLTDEGDELHGVLPDHLAIEPLQQVKLVAAADEWGGRLSLQIHPYAAVGRDRPPDR